MLPTKIYTYVLGANATVRLPIQGKLFKIISATSKVTVTSDFGKLEDLITGQGLQDTPFDYLILTDTSGATNTVKILIGDETFIDAFGGNVSILTNKVPSSSFTISKTQIAITSTQILAANPNRQYLCIQNNEAANDIAINFGTAVTALNNGLSIISKTKIEFVNCVPTQAIFAIATGSNNAQTIVVEG